MHLWQEPFGIMIDPHSEQVGASVRAMKLYAAWPLPFPLLLLWPLPLLWPLAFTCPLLVASTTTTAGRASPLGSGAASDDATATSSGTSLAKCAASQRKM